jgi:hypothetical protein
MYGASAKIMPIWPCKIFPYVSGYLSMTRLKGRKKRSSEIPFLGEIESPQLAELYTLAGYKPAWDV